MDTIKSALKRVRALGLVLSMVAGLVMFSALPSNAATGDDYGMSSVNDKFSGLTGQITTILIPAFLGLVILGIGFAMAVKWLRKGAKQA